MQTCGKYVSIRYECTLHGFATESNGTESIVSSICITPSTSLTKKMQKMQHQNKVSLWNRSLSRNRRLSSLLLLFSHVGRKQRCARENVMIHRTVSSHNLYSSASIQNAFFSGRVWKIPAYEFVTVDCDSESKCYGYFQVIRAVVYSFHVHRIGVISKQTTSDLSNSALPLLPAVFINKIRIIIYVY